MTHFRSQDYVQSWQALRDLHNLARGAGLKGLIILFDEFEDVLTNLGNIRYQGDAFTNMFEFFAGKQFKGMTFFAVTPEFVYKCKNRLMKRGSWDYDYSRFDRLATFEMSPLVFTELTDLARKIVGAHGLAYNWEPERIISRAQVDEIVAKAVALQIQDKTRRTIVAVVSALDHALEAAE